MPLDRGDRPPRACCPRLPCPAPLHSDGPTANPRRSATPFPTHPPGHAPRHRCLPLHRSAATGPPPWLLPAAGPLPQSRRSAALSPTHSPRHAPPVRSVGWAGGEDPPRSGGLFRGPGAGGRGPGAGGRRAEGSGARAEGGGWEGVGGWCPVRVET
uniref:Uncharacterized protein n=1 Tax=Streptomyces kanamyceticus TaxID=1967 RepID=Q1EQT5_STRKN|nr:hypothetical protein [Streptomyces kanamyceticus]